MADGGNDTENIKQVIQVRTMQICKDVEKSSGIVFGKEIVSLISEMAFRQSEAYAKDIECFAKHAKRKRITAEDVLLLARKNSSLRDHLIELKPKTK